MLLHEDAYFGVKQSLKGFMTHEVVSLWRANRHSTMMSTQPACPSVSSAHSRIEYRLVITGGPKTDDDMMAIMQLEYHNMPHATMRHSQYSSRCFSGQAGRSTWGKVVQHSNPFLYFTLLVFFSEYYNIE